MEDWDGTAEKEVDLNWGLAINVIQLHKYLNRKRNYLLSNSEPLLHNSSKADGAAQGGKWNT